MAAISLKLIYIDFQKLIKSDAAKPLTKENAQIARFLLSGRLEQSRHHPLGIDVGRLAQWVG